MASSEHKPRTHETQMPTAEVGTESFTPADSSSTQQNAVPDLQGQGISLSSRENSGPASSPVTQDSSNLPYVDDEPISPADAPIPVQIRKARRSHWEQTGIVPPVSGGSSQEQSRLDPQQLLAFLRTEFTFPAIDLYIETRFEKIGLLAILEKAGILPVAADPNPHDLERETDAYEQWAHEHPDAQEAFQQRLEERQQVLKYLHIGAILGHVAGRDLYPGRKLPR